MVKTIKFNTSLQLSCDYVRENMLSDDDKLSQVKAVEQKLLIDSSEQTNKTLTKKELQSAAEMFVYLNSCPDSLIISWSLFYKDLFLTNSPDQIILTLNRLMETETSKDMDAKLRAKKLLQRTTNLLSLQFEEIGRLKTQKFIKDYSGTDFEIPNGKIFFIIAFRNPVFIYLFTFLS